MSATRWSALACWVAGLACAHLMIVRDLNPWAWLLVIGYLVLALVAWGFADRIDEALK